MFQKLSRPLSMNCSSELNFFANSRPSSLSFKSYSQSLEKNFSQRFRTIFATKYHFIKLPRLSFAWTANHRHFGMLDVFLAFINIQHLSLFHRKAALIIKILLWILINTKLYSSLTVCWGRFKQKVMLRPKDHHSMKECPIL